MPLLAGVGPAHRAACHRAQEPAETRLPEMTKALP
jgi:hypothetical protein